MLGLQFRLPCWDCSFSIIPDGRDTEEHDGGVLRGKEGVNSCGYMDAIDEVKLIKMLKRILTTEQIPCRFP